MRDFMASSLANQTSDLVADLHRHEIESLETGNQANRSVEHVHGAFALGAVGLAALSGNVSPGLWAFPAAYAAWEAGLAFAGRSAAKQGEERVERIEQMRRDVLPPELVGLRETHYEGRMGGIQEQQRAGDGQATAR